jgi:probable HAF family extracellular repeat protein
VSRSAIVTAIVLSLCRPTMAQEVPYLLTTIDFPKAGITSQTATAINDAGKVAGVYQIGIELQGFIYDRGKFKVVQRTSLGAVIRGINTLDHLSGFVTTDRRGFNSRFNGTHGFLEVRGKTTLLDFPGADLTEAIGLNSIGDVVGDYRSGGVFRGFIYNNGSFWTLDFPGASLTGASAINNLGQVVGVADTSTGRHGFLFDSGLFVLLDFPGATLTDPRGINDSGEIVGVYVDASGRNHGFVFDGFGFMTVDFPGSVVTEVWGVNNAGQIIGRYIDGSAVHHSFMGTPVRD